MFQREVPGEIYNLPLYYEWRTMSVSMAEFQPSEKGIKFSVLVVEDDPFLGDLIVRKLVKNGFETPRAGDGEEAIEYLKHNTPHLVLLDIRLPKKDGFEVLEWMQSDPMKAKIPVIILSNINQSEDTERAMKLGAKDYLVKVNYTPDDVVERILRVLHGTYF